MAASMSRCIKFVAQKQFCSAFRLCQNYKRIVWSSPRRFCLLRLITSGTAGIGTSYAFLGFSFSKEKKEDEVDVLTKMYRLARLAHHQQEFQKADELYHQILKLADEQLRTEEITKEKYVTVRTLMCDGLADIALKRGQIETARDLLVETMKGCLQQDMATDHNVIIELSLKLASVCAMMGKKVEAEEGFKFCVQSQSAKMEATEKKWIQQDAKKGKQLEHKPDELEEKEQDSAVLLGMALGSYGRFLLHEKRFKEALPYFERALLFAQHTLGTISNQYIVMMNDIATLHIVSKDYDKAEEMLKRGIAISEKGKLEEVASLYCNLGAVHLRRGQVKEASQACQKGSDLAKHFNHNVAFKMADACLKKCASLKEKSS